MQHQQQQLQNGNEHHSSGGGAEMLNLAADSPDNNKVNKNGKHFSTFTEIHICCSRNRYCTTLAKEKELCGCNRQRMHLETKTTFPSHFQANLFYHVTYIVRGGGSFQKAVPTLKNSSVTILAKPDEAEKPALVTISVNGDGGGFFGGRGTFSYITT